MLGGLVLCTMLVGDAPNCRSQTNITPLLRLLKGFYDSTGAVFLPKQV